MAQFRNISPLGALDLPIARKVIEAGEVVELPDNRAAFIAAQAETWEPVDAAARALVAAVTVEPEEADTEPTTVVPADVSAAPASPQISEEGEAD